MSLFPRQQGSTQLLVEAAAKALAEGKPVNVVTARQEQDNLIRDRVMNHLIFQKLVTDQSQADDCLRRLAFVHLNGAPGHMLGRQGPTLVDTHALEVVYAEKQDAVQSLRIIKTALEAVLGRLR